MMTNEPIKARFMAYFEIIPTGRMLPAKKIGNLLQISDSAILKYLTNLEKENKVSIIRQGTLKRIYIKRKLSAKC
jgi:hypothetical protein